MKRKAYYLLVIFLSLLIVLPYEGFAKGRSSGGGTYVGGAGGSRKGSHYYNPATGNHYRKSGSSSGYQGGSSGHSLRSYGSHSGPGSGYVSEYNPGSHISYSKPFHYHSSVNRDADGKIERSETAKKEFLRMHGYDKVPHGYEVDHIIPLYAGGADDPSNMQLLTKEQHHQKTKSDYQRYGR